MTQFFVESIHLAAALGAVALYVWLPRGLEQTPRAWGWLVAAIALGAFTLLLGRLCGPAGGRVYFCLFSLLALASAARVVTHPRPVYSALFFVMVVLSTAAMLAMGGAELLAAALVIVYAGAILVTYVFVIMLAQQSAPTEGGQFAAALDYDRNARQPGWSVLAGFVLSGAVAGVLANRNWPTPPVVADAGNSLSVGRLLTTDFAVSVELAGVLLMVAMIGAIAISRRPLPRGDEEPETPPGEIGKHVRPF